MTSTIKTELFYIVLKDAGLNDLRVLIIFVFLYIILL